MLAPPLAAAGGEGVGIDDPVGLLPAGAGNGDPCRLSLRAEGVKVDISAVDDGLIKSATVNQQTVPFLLVEVRQVEHNVRGRDADLTTTPHPSVDLDGVRSAAGADEAEVDVAIQHLVEVDADVVRIVSGVDAQTLLGIRDGDIVGSTESFDVGADTAGHRDHVTLVAETDAAVVGVDELDQAGTLAIEHEVVGSAFDPEVVGPFVAEAPDIRGVEQTDEVRAQAAVDFDKIESVAVEHVGSGQEVVANAFDVLDGHHIVHLRTIDGLHRTISPKTLSK